MKQAVRKSNQKDAHMQAMESALFGDWQGRLTMSAPRVSENNVQYLLACFRLLSGRESVIGFQGQLKSEEKDLVVACLNNCVLNELSLQGKFVLSPRLMQSCRKLVWTLQKPEEVFTDAIDSRVKRKFGPDTEALSIMKRVFSGRLLKGTLLQAFSVTGSRFPDDPGIRLSSGEILEILTIDATPSFHNPFVLQSSTMDCFQKINASSLWCADSFFAVEDISHNRSYYVTVRPCIPAVQERHTHGSMYRVDEKMALSIAQLDISMRHVPILQDDNGRSECSTEYFLPLTRKSGFPPRQG